MSNPGGEQPLREGGGADAIAPLWGQPEDGQSHLGRGSVASTGDTDAPDKQDEKPQQALPPAQCRASQRGGGPCLQDKVHREEHVSGDTQRAQERAADSRSPVSISASLTPSCVILLTYPPLPLAQNCPKRIPTLFTRKADIFSTTHKPL